MTFPSWTVTDEKRAFDWGIPGILIEFKLHPQIAGDVKSEMAHTILSPAMAC